MNEETQALVILPTYNEVDNLKPLIQDIMPQDLDWTFWLLMTTPLTVQERWLTAWQWNCQRFTLCTALVR